MLLACATCVICTVVQFVKCSFWENVGVCLLYIYAMYIPGMKFVVRCLVNSH